MGNIISQAKGSFITAVFFERVSGAKRWRRHEMNARAENTWVTGQIELTPGNYEYRFKINTGVGANYETEIRGASPECKAKGVVPATGDLKGGFGVV